MHLGTFHDKEDGNSDKFAEAVQKLDHLQRLGVNVIEVMPLAEFAGALSWGYNPACVFAVETAYGGAAGFKRFVMAVHRAGLGVILDVVYNHFGPGDLDLWQFDGWSENGLGVPPWERSRSGHTACWSFRRTGRSAAGPSRSMSNGLNAKLRPAVNQKTFCLPRSVPYNKVLVELR
jgi:hypothetical protein